MEGRNKVLALDSAGSPGTNSSPCSVALINFLIKINFMEGMGLFGLCFLVIGHH